MLHHSKTANNPDGYALNETVYNKMGQIFKATKSLSIADDDETMENTCRTRAGQIFS